jgi:hypothetical protein
LRPQDCDGGCARARVVAAAEHMPPEREGVVRRQGNEALRWPVMGEERDM